MAGREALVGVRVARRDADLTDDDLVILGDMVKEAIMQVVQVV